MRRQKAEVRIMKEETYRVGLSLRFIFSYFLILTSSFAAEEGS